MGNLNGHDVKEVRVSEGTRRDARGQSRTELVRALQELEDERAAVVGRQNQIQSRLTEIKNILLGNDPNLSKYAPLRSEQSELSKEFNTLCRKAGELKVRLNSLRRDVDQHDRPDRGMETNNLLRKILRELEILNGRQRADAGG